MDNLSALTQGSCELEVLCEGEGEADLHRHLNDCIKNPGHKDFIPVDQFTLDQLPEDYKEIKLLELIKLQAELTVRLTVKFNRENTPQVCAGGDIPILTPTASQKRKTQFGTGHVTNLNISDEDPSLTKVYIQTSAHLFHNEPKQAQITCDFFYDRGSRPGACPDVVTLEDFSITDFHIEQDACEIKIFVSDPVLIKRLENIVASYDRLDKEVCQWYHGDFIPNHECDEEKALSIIVSHPHGCSKQISVGYCTNINPAHDSYYTKLIYTTATCPGSSGADVFLLGFRRDDHKHIHYGEGQDNKFNCSNDGLELYDFSKDNPRKVRDSSNFKSDIPWSTSVRFLIDKDIGGENQPELMRYINEECSRQDFLNQTSSWASC